MDRSASTTDTPAILARASIAGSFTLGIAVPDESARRGSTTTSGTTSTAFSRPRSGGASFLSEDSESEAETLPSRPQSTTIGSSEEGFRPITPATETTCRPHTVATMDISSEETINVPIRSASASSQRTKPPTKRKRLGRQTHLDVITPNIIPADCIDDVSVNH